MNLQDNERIDDLEYKGLKIIQNKEAFCFGIDSILLSDFAKEIKNGSKVIDLGTGNGIIGIMLCAKTELSKMIGVEVQEESAKLTKRNIELNNFEEKFGVINKNINDLEDVLQMGTFDAVVTNPPYKKVGTGMTNENEKKLIARHEIKANLEDFIRVSSKLLKDKGNFYMVHRPDRLVDIIDNLRKYRLEPKVIRFIHPSFGKEPNMLLIKATKNGKPFLKVQEPLYVYKGDGEYTDEILEIYNKKGSEE